MDGNRTDRNTTVSLRRRECSSIASQPVFVVDDTFFRSRTPPTPHWSIAWSDLMMTMFVLFLTLFVYQLAHRDFLSRDKVEVVGGRSIDVPEHRSTALPFYPIYPQVAENDSKILRQVKDVPAVKESGDVFQADGSQAVSAKQQAAESETPAEQPVPAAVHPPELQEPLPLISPEEIIPADALPATDGETPLQAEKPWPAAKSDEELITEIYDLSKYTLASEKLEKFASVELIPDKTMRIILTGDLLFDSGQAELTDQAKRSLAKLAKVIRQTPYMINVVGHTDSVPMSSPRYPTNWELSTARACRVARFLIEDIGIPASQFVVSGFSYLRPVAPNDTERNRRANRRVEIILSREPAQARKMSTDAFGPAAAAPESLNLFSSNMTKQ